MTFCLRHKDVDPTGTQGNREPLVVGPTRIIHGGLVSLDPQGRRRRLRETADERRNVSPVNRLPSYLPPEGVEYLVRCPGPPTSETWVFVVVLGLDGKTTGDEVPCVRTGVSCADFTFPDTLHSSGGVSVIRTRPKDPPLVPTLVDLESGRDRPRTRPCVPPVTSHLEE